MFLNMVCCFLDMVRACWSTIYMKWQVTLINDHIQYVYISNKALPDTS